MPERDMQVGLVLIIWVSVLAQREEAKTMLKAAVVGCGGIGTAHLRALHAIEGVEIAAVVASRAALAQKAAIANSPLFPAR